MNKKVKVRNRLNTFTYEEVKQLLKYYGFEEMRSGKQGSSVIKFYNKASDTRIYIHRPHPGNFVKRYILREIINILDKEDLR